MATETQVGGESVVQHPPLLSNFCTDSDQVVLIVSQANQHADGFIPVLVKGKFGYAQGTIAIDAVDTDEIVRLTKLEGDNKIPVATKIV